MKILFFQNDLNPSSGGIARVSWSLGNYFVNQGHDVHYMYYLSDFDKIDSHHKCKYQFTMDEKLMYRQIGDYIKQVGGGRFCHSASPFLQPCKKGVSQIA